MSADTPASHGARRNTRRFALVTLGMFGFGFALVPMYGAVCQLVGFNGRPGAMLLGPGAAENPQARLVTVELLTSVNGGLPMSFHTERQMLQVHPGQLYTVNFTARNDDGSRALVAQAVPSVSPWSAARHLKKTECFCFRQQPFAAGEERALPMRFMLDPELPPEIETVTLSYTLFDVTEMAARAAGKRS